MPSTNKTVATDTSVAAFLSGLDESRREDCQQLIALMSEATSEPPRMWGVSMVGFGSYHYRYESGREGDAMLAGFSPRVRELSIYLMGRYLDESRERADALLSTLGKHRAGKACLYVKRLSDIDLDKLRELTGLSVEGDGINDLTEEGRNVLHLSKSLSSSRWPPAPRRGACRRRWRRRRRRPPAARRPGRPGSRRNRSPARRPCRRRRPRPPRGPRRWR